MAVNVYLDNTNLQSSPYSVSTVRHDSSPPIDVSTDIVTARDGELLVGSTHRIKEITLEGYVTGTSISNLETNIDAFKELMEVTEGKLDIEWAGSYRRYTVARGNVAITRDYYHVTFVPWAVVFQVLDPPYGFQPHAVGGQLAINEAFTAAAQTGSRYSGTWSFDGTAKPKPRMVVTMDTGGSIWAMEIKNNTSGSRLYSDVTFTSGDRLEIDTAKREAYLNLLTPLDFEGEFPQFNVGDNLMEITFLGEEIVLDQQQANYANKRELKLGTDVIAQSFEPDYTDSYYKVDVLLKKVKGTAANTLTLTGWTNNGGVPSQTTVSNFFATLSTANIPEKAHWCSFVFATAPSLTADTTYHFTLQLSNGIGSARAYDGVEVFHTRESLYADGQMNVSTTDGSSWKQHTDKDLAFKVFYTKHGAKHSADIKTEYTKRYL